MNKELTKRQREMLVYIADFMRENQYSPTIRELGEVANITSTNGVNSHLRNLEVKGYIQRDKGRSRSILLTDMALMELGMEPGAPSPLFRNHPSSSVPVEDDLHVIPLLGDIAAGLPIEGQARADEYLKLDPSMLRMPPGREVIALRVQGESMTGDGIMDGDYVFVQRAEDSRSMEVVALRLDGAVTVKRWMRVGGEVHLLSSNPDIETIVVRESDARELQVIGKVIGVFRSMA